MKTRHWIIIAVLLSLGLIIALVPVVFAQGPFTNNGWGSSPLADTPAAGQAQGWGQGAMQGQGWMMNGGSGAAMRGQGRMMNGGSGMMGRGNENAPRLGQAIIPGFNGGRSANWGGPNNSLLAVTATVLEMERSDLMTKLQAGQTLADVITEQGVALETVVDAFIAPRETMLEEQVAAGEITQEQADTLLTAMKANATAQLRREWTARGPGGGNGFVDEDGDGICDHAGTGQGRGQGFVDEDGDGICDHAGSGGPGRGQGQGQGRGQGRMMGRWTQ